jgi:CDP-diacylglycerol---glycerol-3-phosphate 3-phosphatidyltransferase
LPVTALRLVASERGVSVPVSQWGKAKTACQVVAIFALIAVGDPAWVLALVYVTVVVTVISGAEYFLDFRRELGRRQASSHSRIEV